jgi:hypothetical protein
MQTILQVWPSSALREPRIFLLLYFTVSCHSQGEIFEYSNINIDDDSFFILKRLILRGEKSTMKFYEYATLPTLS